MNPITLTPEQLVELRDSMYTADAALRAVLDDTSGNDPASIKRARNLLAASLSTLRAEKRRAEQAADEGAPHSHLCPGCKAVSTMRDLCESCRSETVTSEKIA